MEKQLNSSGIFSEAFPECFAKTEHRTGKVHRPDHLYVNVQWHQLDRNRKWWNLYFEFRKSQGIRAEILTRTLDVLWSWRRKEVVWNSSSHTWREMGFYSHSDGGTIQRYRWIAEKEERQRHHTRRCGCFEYRTLNPNHSLCESAQCLRSSFE